MNHQDHVNLIKKGILHTGGVWADLGSGEGAFTLALRDVAGSDVGIYSIDKDEESLEIQRQHLVEKFPHSHITYLATDFTKPLNLPPVDGIIMANSLHYVQDKVPLLESLRACIKPGGVFIIVEYNVDSGNMWVPYPLSFSSFQSVMKTAHYKDPKLLATIPSHFLQEIYSAIAYAH